MSDTGPPEVVGRSILRPPRAGGQASITAAARGPSPRTGRVVDPGVGAPTGAPRCDGGRPRILSEDSRDGVCRTSRHHRRRRGRSARRLGRPRRGGRVGGPGALEGGAGVVRPDGVRDAGRHRAGEAEDRVDRGLRGGRFAGDGAHPVVAGAPVVRGRREGEAGPRRPGAGLRADRAGLRRRIRPRIRPRIRAGVRPGGGGTRGRPRRGPAPAAAPPAAAPAPPRPLRSRPPRPRRCRRPAARRPPRRPAGRARPRPR